MPEILSRGNYLQVRLRGKSGRSPHDGTGALVTARCGGRRQLRVAGTGGSYLCAGDPRVYFGLGVAERVDELSIRWPSGSVQRLQNLRANRQIEVAEP